MTRARDLADIIGPNGDLVVAGDLQVTGTTTTVNSTTVEIADNNILLGSGATTNAQNTGAGLSVLLPDASPDEFATLLYTTSSDSWSFNKNVGIGIDSPGSTLHIDSSTGGIVRVSRINTNANEYGQIEHDGTDTTIKSTGATKFYNSTDYSMTIYDSGTLAIGAGASSNYLLSTNYDANATFSNAVSDFTQMWQNSGTNMLGVAGADDLSVRLVTNNGYALAFNNAGTEAFRITTGGNIEAPSGTSGNFEIGIEDNATDTFRTSAKGLIIKGNDAYTGASPQQASAGGDVEVRAGFGVDNSGLGTFAGDLTLSGGIPSTGSNSGAGQIFLKTNNTEVLTVSRDQKVGIGTTSPSGTLVVSTNGAQGIEFFPTAAAGVASTQYYNRSGTAYIRNRNIALDHTFNLSGATDDALIIAASGNVGIGTNFPAAKLDVSSATGTATITPTEMSISSSSSGSDWVTGSSNEWGILGFYKADTSGGGASNVATIGASMVNAVGGYGSLHFKLQNSSNAYALEEWLTLQNSASAAGRQVSVFADGGLYVENNVGIGTTNPGSKLQIQTSHTETDVTTANSNSTLNVANSGSGDGVYNAIKFAANQQDMYIMSFNNNQQADRRLGFFLGSVAGDATTDERLSIRGNGNVGIGTTSPNAALSLGAAIAAKRFLVYDGGGGNNLYAGFGIDSPASNDFTMYAHNDGRLKFGKMSTNGSTITPHMTIDNSGNVGIRTDSPNAALDILGASSDQLRLRTAETEEYQIGRNASTGLLDFYGSQTGFTGYTFGGVDGERMRIDSSGAVIVNNSGGDAQIYLGGSSGPSRMYLARAGTAAQLWNVDNGVMQFGTNNTERMSITSNGNLLLQQTSAAVYDSNTAGDVSNFWKMSASGSSTDTRSIIGSNSTGGIFGGTRLNTGGTRPIITAFMEFSCPDTTAGAETGEIYFYTKPSGGVASSTKRMVINSSGNLLVGDSSTLTGARIELFGPANGVAGIGMRHTGATAGQWWRIYMQNDSKAIFTNAAGTGVSLTYGGTSWSAVSDEELKENISDIGTVLDKVTNYRCVNYSLKATQSASANKIGFIAQDWETDFPNVVDRDENDELSMKYTETIPVLLKAIQEQNEIINDLRTRVAQLEGAN